MSEWRTIDTAPKDVDVLVYCPNDGWSVARYYERKKRLKKHMDGSVSRR